MLITELADEFNARRQQTEQEIGPSGTIGKIMANNICSISWEMHRLQSVQTTIHYEQVAVSTGNCAHPGSRNAGKTPIRVCAMRQRLLRSDGSPTTK